MIRKILVLITAIFAITWFAGAHLIKRRTTSLVKSLESDNIKITYDKINISGFPKIWKIRIIEPKVKFVNHVNSRELSSKELQCIFTPSFKKAKLVFIDGVKQEENFGDQRIYYYLNYSQPITTIVKFNKPFYKVTSKDNFNHIMETFTLVDSSLKGTFEENEIFNLTDLTLKISKMYFQDKEDTSLKINAIYNGQNYLLGFNSANLNLDAVYTVQSKQEDIKIYPYKILKINNLSLKVEDSNIALNGKMENYTGKLPQGQFFVNLNNYPKVIDKLVHQNFIIPKTTLKKIIAKAVNKDKEIQLGDDILENNEPQKNTTEIDAAFEIKFSEEGIKIGLLNLLDFQYQD